MDAQAVLVWIVPLFFVFMAAEFVYFYSRGRNIYKFSDTLASLSCGFGQAIIDTILQIGLLAAYGVLQSSLGIAVKHLTIGRFLFTFIVIDLAYYIYHRLSHSINWMWAIHVVHHSSSEFNYSVALRQAWFQKFSAFPFYLLFIFTGTGPIAIGGVIAIHACWQFLSHTRTLPREIPILRWIFVTPSHHRVHHGINPQYQNKNFAGVFSIWDRLFASYEPEKEEVKYGILPALQNYGVWNVNTHGWREIWDQLQICPTITAKWKLLWGPPLNVNRENHSKRKKRSPGLLATIFGIIFLFCILYLANYTSMNLHEALMLSSSLIGALVFAGNLLDQLQT
ncbi:MAG: hypothetical protein A4S09_00775 [Proteobacteria bacterium SG_bin7]|nr:MAG: hypothetical protein A4S09_00775 [Proteobacteria bacterium SG_bin7]